MSENPAHYNPQRSNEFSKYVHNSDTGKFIIFAKYSKMVVDLTSCEFIGVEKYGKISRIAEQIDEIERRAYEAGIKSALADINFLLERKLTNV